jgi:hypothetical protein
MINNHKESLSMRFHSHIRVVVRLCLAISLAISLVMSLAVSQSCQESAPEPIKETKLTGVVQLLTPSGQRIALPEVRVQLLTAAQALQATSAADGSFSIASLKQGTYAVQVSGFQQALLDSTVTISSPSSPLVLTVRANLLFPSVVGIVTGQDPRGMQRRLSNLTITVGDAMSATTTREGVFALTNVSMDKYRIGIARNQLRLLDTAIVIGRTNVYRSSAAQPPDTVRFTIPITEQEADDLSFRIPLAVGNEWVYSFKEQRRFGRTGMPDGPLIEGTFAMRITNAWRGNDTTTLYSYRAIRTFAGANAGLIDTVMIIPQGSNGSSYWYGGIQAEKSEITFPLDNRLIRKYEVAVSTAIDRNMPFEAIGSFKLSGDTLSMAGGSSRGMRFPYNLGNVIETAYTRVVHNVGIVYIKGEYSVGSTLTTGEWHLVSYKLQP